MAGVVSDYSAELIEKLKQQMETLFIQEWGGPRGDLALTYLREHTIPQLLRVIVLIDGQLSKDELICHFARGCSISLNSSCVLRYSQKDEYVKVIIDSLLANNLLVAAGGIDSRLSLSPRAGSLAAMILAPKLADEILSLLHSGKRDRVAQAAKLLLNKNREVVVQVIKELARKKDTNVLVLFKILYHKVNKTVLLEIIAGCGELGGRDVNIILTKSLQNRDSMVRVKACQAIKKLADKSYYFQLINALQDPVPLVREQAVHALGALGLSSAMRHLKDIIENQQESLSVQQAAREVFAKLQFQKNKFK